MRNCAKRAACCTKPPGRTGRPRPAARPCWPRTTSNCRPTATLRARLQALLTGALERAPRFLAAALPKKLFPPQFNRYGGEHNAYGAHVDNAVRFAGNLRVRTDLSCTVFLSAPGDYDGGELVILGAGEPQRVKLPAGHAVLYPGTSVHEVTPVTRGSRLASFFWVESMVRSDEQRQLLLQMDDAITALRTSQGENPSTIALTGTYHNLLRMWADT
jgi:PKHD-type hydroxylase